MDKQLIQSGFDSDCIVSVKSAVKQLKVHESNGDYCLSTDRIINVPDDCLLHISWLLSTIIIHGCHLIVLL